MNLENLFCSSPYSQHLELCAYHIVDVQEGSVKRMSNYGMTSHISHYMDEWTNE